MRTPLVPTAEEIAEMVREGEGTYSAAAVKDILVVTATKDTGILAAAVRYSAEGYVAMHLPFERDPGVWAVTLYRPG